MPPAEVLHAENLSLKREVEELKGTNALLKWQIEKLQKQVFGPGKSDGVRSTETAQPGAKRRVSRTGARKAGGAANKSWIARSCSSS